MKAYQKVLFEPLKINKLMVQGRVYKAATTETLATVDGFIGDEYLEYYQPLAMAGTPLIITGNMYVGFSGKPTYRSPGIDDDDKLPGLRRLTDMVHAVSKNGPSTVESKIIAQINHVGRQTNVRATGVEQALAPSAVREMTTFTKPRAMTIKEISRTVKEFASASQRAQRAGFDGVQIHISHGYLLNEFLTPHTNRRTDKYGGSFENRLRLPLEVIKAVRSKVGEDYPLLIKLNGADLLFVKGGLGTQEFIEVAKALVAVGVDAIEISCAHYESGFPMLRGRFDNVIKNQMKFGQGLFLPKWRRQLMGLMNKPIAYLANRRWPTEEGFNLEFARQFKKALNVPIITVGGFHSGEGMTNAILQGDTDAVSVARGMVANPYLVQDLRDDTTVAVCDYCNQCIARGARESLACVNPLLTEKDETMLEKMNNC